MLWVMTSARAAGVAAMLLVLLVMPPKAPWRGFWLTGIAGRRFWTRSATCFYIRATQLGRLDVAALVCSLYPGGHHPAGRAWCCASGPPPPIAGMALALAAVALLSL